MSFDSIWPSYKLAVQEATSINLEKAPFALGVYAALPQHNKLLLMHVVECSNLTQLGLWSYLKRTHALCSYMRFKLRTFISGKEVSYA